MASRLSLWMSAACTSAFQACGLSLCIRRAPASQRMDSPIIRAAMRSGQCQLIVPGRNDHSRIPASNAPPATW
jgi:hypothetical protein